MQTVQKTRPTKTQRILPNFNTKFIVAQPLWLCASNIDEYNTKLETQTAITTTRAHTATLLHTRKEITKLSKLQCYAFNGNNGATSIWNVFV